MTTNRKDLPGSDKRWDSKQDWEENWFNGYKYEKWTNEFQIIACNFNEKSSNTNSRET
jgi:hypothetical protein